MTIKSSLLASIVFAALGLGGIAGAVAVVGRSRPQTALAAEDPSLARSLHALESDLKGVESRLVSLEQRPAPASVDSAAAPSRLAEPLAAAPRDVAAPAAPVDPAIAKDAAIAAAAKELTPALEKLLIDGVPADDLKKFLAAVGRQGSQEGAIVAAQALVEKNPTDPKARYLLAKACYARCMLESTPAGFEKWGGMTLAAWEKASELDPNYWEPRFERAEYLTYYPESEGKTPEVISEFEKLIEKQGGSNRNARFAKSYAHLSRMYLRVGKRDKAIRTLRDGSTLFPDDAELRKQLEVLEKE